MPQDPPRSPRPQPRLPPPSSASPGVTGPGAAQSPGFRAASLPAEREERAAAAAGAGAPPAAVLSPSWRLAGSFAVPDRAGVIATAPESGRSEESCSGGRELPRWARRQVPGERRVPEHLPSRLPAAAPGASPPTRVGTPPPAAGQHLLLPAATRQPLYLHP